MTPPSDQPGGSPAPAVVDPCWASVDAIVVINLDIRPDRWRHFLDGPGRLLPAEKLHRLGAVLGAELPGYGAAPWFTERTGDRAAVWGGTAGCALSHRNAIALAKEQGWRNVLILEDDVDLRPPDAGASALVRRALEELRGPAMLYLGFNIPVPFGRPVLRGDGADIWKMDGVLAAHAYIVTAELYDTLLARLPDVESVWPWIARYRAVDNYYRDYVPALPGVAVYALVPVLFRQAGSQSNISQRYANGPAYSCDAPPHRLGGPRGWLHRLATPLRRLKIHLNALRTYHRARSGGLPGNKRRA